MNIYFYDLIFLAVFAIVVGVFLYRHKHRAKWEGILLLYRTQVGVNFIDWVDIHFGKWIRKLKWVIIVTGYFSMIAMTAMLIQTLYIFFRMPEVVRAVKIPPLAPLIPYLPEMFNVSFLPNLYFTYWIIAIAIIAISHEFAHGIFARINNVKIKSTGFGFLGPFIAAFVEPDEEEMKKIKKSDQLAILGAGSFANIIMMFIFLLIMWGFFSAAYYENGFVFKTYAYSIVNISSITSVGGIFGGNIMNVLDDGKAMEILGANFSAVEANGRKGYVDIELTKAVVTAGGTQTLFYEDAPAINARMMGVIVEIDGERVRNHAELKSVLATKSAGQSVRVVTEIDDKMESYNIILGRNPQNGAPYIGVASEPTGGGKSVMGAIRGAITFFDNPNTDYKPRFNPGLTDFIKDLIWWLIIINMGVALANMLPIGIFDGGRVFFITLWGIFGSESKAKKGYKIATYFILAIFILLMVAWAVAMF